MQLSFRSGRVKSYRLISIFSLCAIILNMSFLGVFFVALPINEVSAEEPNKNMCVADVDVVLVMDRSGSMADGAVLSKCEWTEPREFEGSSYFFLNTTYDKTEQWCMGAGAGDDFDETYIHGSYKATTYTPAQLSKIESAKQAANSFLGKLGSDDQSALVSFANNATLDKYLTNVHTEIGNLTTEGATNIGEAIDSANQEIVTSGRANPQANKIIILLTDGRANRPNGAGDPDPEVYAKTKALESADQNIKIFTIGLGKTTGQDSINEPMLQEIADITGATYYHAPTSDDLESIYNDIKSRICRLGSITVCKYNDSNNDGDINGEDFIVDWEMTLSDGVNENRIGRTNNENGCYTFISLPHGEYTVSETIKDGWQKTYPIEDFWTINLAEGEATTTVFGNYQIPDEPETGSISGCKYNDLDGDGDLADDVVVVPDWTIYLNGTKKDSQQTNGDGCYSFTDLANGRYTVTEDLSGDWVQTYPSASSSYEHVVIISNHNNKTNIDFGNYLPSATPATSSISGYKYEDLDKDASTTKIVDEEWVISLFDINASTTATTTTDSYGYYIFENLVEGIYEISEYLFGNWIQLLAPDPVDLENDDSTDNNFINYLPFCGNSIVDSELDEECDDGPNGSGVCASDCTIKQVENPYCGDGAVNQTSEQCDDGNKVSGDGCSSTCQTEGGGGGSTPLSLRNEQVVCISETEVEVTWLTNKYASGRVVYGTESQASIGASPNYGYAYSTAINSNNLMSHSVNIAGLENNIYYFRPIANISSDTFGDEIAFNMADCKVIVLGEEGAPILTISKTASKEKVNPGETDIEFVITVKNEGNLTAFNVKLNDILPSGISFQDFDGNIKDWDLGDINSGEEVIIKYMAGVDANAAAKVYANNASASADNHATVNASAGFEVERVIVLAETGFRLSEFIMLFISLLTLAGSAMFIRSRQVV